MHKYLRAVGFSSIKNIKQLEPLFKSVIENPDKRIAVCADDSDISAMQIDRDFGEDIGISMVGELDEAGNFLMEHYFPYVRPDIYVYDGFLEVEERLINKSYAGISDDSELSLIFYVQNIVDIDKKRIAPSDTVDAVMLAALSDRGSILLPIAQPSEGEDLFSMVETSIIPCGVECELYRIVGTILDVRHVQNLITGERVILMNISCNDYKIRLAINEMDLIGEPEKGRRFRGDIWLQGVMLLD